MVSLLHLPIAPSYWLDTAQHRLVFVLQLCKKTSLFEILHNPTPKAEVAIHDQMLNTALVKNSIVI